MEKNFSGNNLSVGLHYITLQVQDNEGGVFTTHTREIKIYALPVAIAGDDITLYIDDNVETSDDNTATFRGQGTDEDGHIVLYEWDFDGNGFYEHSSTENGRGTNYYGSVGNYNAVLRVTDDDGFTSMDYLVVKIRNNSDKDNEDDSEIPTISMTATIITVATIARCRRY